GPAEAWPRRYDHSFSQLPYIGFGSTNQRLPNGSSAARLFRDSCDSPGKSWMLSPTHASTRSGCPAPGAVPSSTILKRGFLSLVVVLQRIIASRTPMASRLTRVSVQSESARLVTIATLPPASWTARMNSTAPGIGFAARSRTHGTQLESLNDTPAASVRRSCSELSMIVSSASRITAQVPAGRSRAAASTALVAWRYTCRVIAGYSAERWNQVRCLA